MYLLCLVYREALLVPVVNCLTSIFAGFVVFTVLGHIAHEKGVSVANVTQGGGY
jgi:solute carrier family 6 amino acid transporter-like protein 5/7/9/14